MGSNNFLNDVLRLYDDLIVKVNIKDKLVLKVLDGEKEIGENMSYEDFSKLFGEVGDFNPASVNKIYKFFCNLNLSDEPFTISAKYETNLAEIVRVQCKGVKINEDEAVISFCRMDKEAIGEYDSLTKIFTKAGIQRKIEEALNEKRPFALMIVDLDEFESINSSYGHVYGDIVLVEAAASIKKYLKTDGFVSRIGGDKFMLLTYVEDDYNYIHKACTNIRAAISNLQNHNVVQASIKATLGCASYPKDGCDFDTLYKKATIALARGKKKGRNCFIIYDESKCGKVDQFDVKQMDTFEETSTTNADFNIIAGIFEMLNRRGSKIKNIEDSLNLIGNYFLLDRASLITLDPDNHILSRNFTWHNPRIDKHEIKIIPENLPLWDESFDNMGMLKICQVESNKNLPLYKVLNENHCSSIIAFKLKYGDKDFGTIHFEMCEKNRFWSPSDVSSLMLISKIFSIFLNKEYENIQHIRELSYDRVTNIYNYSKWRDVLYEKQSDRNDPDCYSMVYLSFNEFMHLNDLLGTVATDQILVSTALGLRQISKDELFCRVSEDKFLIFFTTMDKEYILNYIKNLQEFIINDLSYGNKFKLVAGIYVHDDISDNMISAIDKANLARKLVKSGEQYLFFSNDIYENQRKQLRLELHMYEAKKNEEFLLYLQPKVNTLTGKVVGAEALTRWHFMKTQILTPNHFIPLFEQNGFINELDLIVFENVCKYQRKIIDSGYKAVPISLNVSRYQRNFIEYVNKINEIRAQYDISPSLIEIEITEGMYIDNIELISEMMKKLHDSGYLISMDDFGAGYSNLSSLASLDFDTIKLDRGFCSDQNNEKEQIILSFIVTLSKKLNMNVLCEGVETKELVEFLQKIGCYLVQGFYYERPIPSSDFTEKYLTKSIV